MTTTRDFDALLADAVRVPLQGWDFARLGERIRGAEPWNYTEFVREVTAGAANLLDLGTGRGEWLSSYDARPALTVATESWSPNVPVAHRTLAPLGISVVHTEPAPDNAPATSSPAGRLPFRDGSFDAVVARHESYRPAEIARVLRPGAIFATQQVSTDGYAAIRELLGEPPGHDPGWHLATAVAQLTDVGLTMISETVGTAETVFADVGALAWWLAAIPWAVPGFTVDRFRDRLRELHDTGDPIVVLEPRFRLVAQRPT